MAAITPTMSKEGLQPVAPDLNIEMGHIYHSDAIVSEDANDSRVHENPRESKDALGPCCVGRTRRPEQSLSPLLQQRVRLSP